MKPHKSVFGFFFIIFPSSAGILCGVPVTLQEAEIAARNFVCSQYPAPQAQAGIQAAPRFSIQQVQPWTMENETIGFVASLSPAGYVLMRADDEIPPIKIYSEHGSFTNLPPEFARVIALELMEELGGVAQIRTKGNIDSKFHGQWKSMLSNASGANAIDESMFPVPPKKNYLLITTWGQDYPYNYYAPKASHGPGGRVYAGCVAVAMAQIIRYHCRPYMVLKDYTYTDNSGNCQGRYAIRYAEMDNYVWSDMRDAVYPFSPGRCIQAVSRLIYHCAVSVKTDFETDCSNAFYPNVGDALRDFFGYQAGEYVLYSDYSTSGWYQKIKTDIDNYCPVFYTLDSDYGGHAVVCDGYAEHNTIHLNLGWEGACDVWYNLDSIITGHYTSHGAILRIDNTMPPGAGIPPEPHVYIDGDSGPVALTENDFVEVSISVMANEYTGENFDWWAIASTPTGWYYLNLSRRWVPIHDLAQAHPAYQGRLTDIPYGQILSMPSLSPGVYTFYFGLDAMNGVLDDSVVYDGATVIVNIEHKIKSNVK